MSSEIKKGLSKDRKAFTIIKHGILPGSEATIEGELTSEAVNEQRKNALNQFQSALSIDGFRKGHIPEKVIVEKIGELGIYEESASHALEKHFGEIIRETKLAPIGDPKIAITKIAPGTNVSFRIQTAILPEATLPDYKKIAAEFSKEKSSVVVEDKEVDEALDQMRRSLAHHEKHHQQTPDGTTDPQEDDAHSHDEHDDHTGKDIPETDLPLLNDEFAKKIANLESLEILKTKLRETIQLEKESREKEKTRLLMIEKIVADTTVELPAILRDSEMEKMLAEFRSNIERMGMKLADYLSHISKTEENLKGEWKDEAEKRAKIQLVLSEIATKEKIVVPDDEIERETDVLMKRYGTLSRSRVSNYVRSILLNEHVWKFLEEQK